MCSATVHASASSQLRPRPQLPCPLNPVPAHSYRVLSTPSPPTATVSSQLRPRPQLPCPVNSCGHSETLAARVGAVGGAVGVAVGGAVGGAEGWAMGCRRLSHDPLQSLEQTDTVASDDHHADVDLLASLCLLYSIVHDEVHEGIKPSQDPRHQTSTVESQ